MSAKTAIHSVAWPVKASAKKTTFMSPHVRERKDFKSESKRLQKK